MSDKLQKKIEDAYRFASLSKYSFVQRLTIRLADLVFYALISVIGKTLKYETRGAEHLDLIAQKGEVPIYTSWHNRIFAGAFYLRNRKIVIITSQSFDGEYIARFLIRFGFGTVRGSSTRGGIGALVEMIRLIRAGLPMLFTIDGPKGPKYVAKSGACLLAKKTGSPMVPCLVEVERFWTVKSWDDLQIPKPFSRAFSHFSTPIYVAKDADEKELEEKRAELQNELDELVRVGVQWRESVTK